MSSTSNHDISKGRIVIVEGQSQYRVLNKACHLMAKGFEENGYEVTIIDTASFSAIDVFANAIIGEMSNDGLFLMSFNAIYHDVVFKDQHSLYEKLGYKTLGFLVDHPFYHNKRITDSQSDNIYIGCIDPDHVTYINQYYPNLKHVGFLPHFSFQSEQLIPYEERTISIYYPGSYQNPDLYKNNFANLPKVFRDIAMEVFEIVLHNSKMTIEEALRYYLKSVKFEYTSEDFIEIMSLIFFVDHLIRDYRRDKIVRTILEAGIDITVSGKGWEQMEQAYQGQLHIVGKEGLDIEENLKLIANTKILFNTFPNFKNGTHERIFTAMRNGCVCLTDPSGYLLENFANNENLVYYDISHLEGLPEIIKSLLHNPQAAKEIAEAGYEKASIEYNERNTAKRVLNFMGLDEK